MSLSRFDAPRASWWRRLWHRDIAARLDLRERRRALLALYPWATWREVDLLARAMRDESVLSKPLDELVRAAWMASVIRVQLEARGLRIAKATGVLGAAERISREAYQASRDGKAG